MSEQYTIQATLNDSPATVVTGVLTVKVVEADEAIDTTWVITDPNDDPPTLPLQKNKPVLIYLSSPLNLTLAANGAIIVKLPDGNTEALDEILDLLGGDGYLVESNPAGGTKIIILYTPSMNGEIGLDITYSLDSGITTETQSLTGVGKKTYSGGWGSSSSCGVGFGIAGILALAGFALTRKRTR